MKAGFSYTVSLANTTMITYSLSISCSSPFLVPKCTVICIVFM